MRAKSNRRWKSYLLRKTDGRQFRGCPEPVRAGEKSQSKTRRGAGQALGAGTDEVENASRSWLLRQDTLSARRVWLLGLRRRYYSGSAPVLELPQGRRRRNHHGHAVPLALRPRQSFWRGEVGFLRWRNTRSEALG